MRHESYPYLLLRAICFGMVRFQSLIRRRLKFFILTTLLLASVFFVLNVHQAHVLSSLPLSPPQVSLDESFCDPTNHLCQYGLQNNRGHLRLTGFNLPYVIGELMRINHSVHNELIDLESRRSQLISSVNVLQTRLEKLRLVLYEQTQRFMRLKASINSHELHLNELKDPPLMFFNHLPRSLLGSKLSIRPAADLAHTSTCSMDTCVDWNYCPLTDYLRLCIRSSFVDNLSLPLLPNVPACPNEFNSDVVCLQLLTTPDDALACLKEHRHQPTCVAIFTDTNSSLHFFNLAKPTEQSRLLIASSYFPSGQFRPGYDFFLFANHEPFDGHPKFVHIFPGRRPILLAGSVGSPFPRGNAGHVLSENFSNHQSDASIHLMFHTNTTELVSCWPGFLREAYSKAMFNQTDWFPCYDALKVLSRSTFGLVLSDFSTHSVPSLGWQLQLTLCFASGAIPVVIGDPMFPLLEAISSSQWSRAVVRIPKHRVPELLVILRSIPEVHLVELRRQGQVIYNRYLKTPSQRLSTFLLALNRRFGYPQPPVPEWKARPAYRDFHPSSVYPVNVQSSPYEADDFLGPVGPDQESARYVGNYTSPGGSARYATCSSPFDVDSLVDPFWSYPSTPWDAFLPSDAAHHDKAPTRHNLRPIDHSANLAGYEFNMNLGGMYPYEQFTVVLLAYKRFHVLCKTLEQLLNLPYLQSVLVVWNNPEGPSTQLKWPQLHVPIKVIKSTNNSLNNRFLPYDLIRTDCVFSADDDIQLRQDELIFGFRVWRENRDRIVGFPTRAHFWNATGRNWYYNSDYTCEMSMILTGAAFLHKYYLFAYTYEMPLSIRQLVDERMNCEDLAMNFLVAHLTRKAPMKVTVHWVINCPWCGPSLHDQSGHYSNRSFCINWLTEFYGYNPLVYTQLRADSILFKTRLPPTKQKCYKFV